MKGPLCVGVSGINATDNPGPGVAVARSLKEDDPGIQLIGLSYDVHDPGNYLDCFFENSFLLPYPSQGWLPLEAACEKVRRKTGMNFLIPCLDAELPLMIRYQPQLERLGIRSFLPTEAQFDLRSKDKLMELADELGCRYPKTLVANSLDQVADSLKQEVSLPAMIKGRYYKAYLVYNLQAALLKGAEIAAEWGYPLLIQERVEGSEINLIGLGDGEGGLLGRVAIRKQLTTHLGKVWTAVTIVDEALLRLSENFCRVTKWRGPFEIECIQSGSGLYLIEINPRFPAWVYFATAVGVNLPRRLIDYASTGACEDSLDYPVGKFLVRQTSEFVTELSNFQNLVALGNREGI